MTQTSNGSITITDLTDITDVYLQYCMAVDSITTAAAIIAKTSWTPPERGWSTEYPTWQSGYQIWIREVTKKEGIAQLEYGTPYLDKAVNQINNNISNIQTKIKKIWSDSTGSYMASGIGGNDVIENNVNTYGFNSKSTTTGISFNYNAIPLTTLGTDGLKLYSPVLTNSIITGNRLDATLTSEGLKLLRGGIEAGTKNTSDYIYVYSHDDATNHTLAINNSGNKSDWRIIAGKNFGVDKAGNLYANEAHISGTFTVKAGSESNIYTKDESDEKVQEEVGKVISVKEASGNIVHIKDASEYPALSLKVNIEPIQDLHGYDHPWVGGAGKNKLPMRDEFTINGVKFTPKDDGTYIIQGTTEHAAWTNSPRIHTLQELGISVGETVTFSTNIRIYGFFRDSEGANTGVSFDTSGSTFRSVTVPNNAVSAIIYLYGIAELPSAGQTINTVGWFQLEKGSTATAFEPYSNICPISGWSSVDAYKSGVNIWDEEWEQGDLSGTDGTPISSTAYIRSKNFCPCKVEATYYLIKGTATKMYIFWYDESETHISHSIVTADRTMSAPSNAKFFKLTIAGATYNNDISINYPSTDHEYHAYNGQTITKALGQTVYGCEVDIVSGLMTVDRAMVDLGTLTWETASAGIFYSQTIDNFKTVPNWITVPNIICSWYQTTYGDAIANASIDKAIANYGVQNRVFVRDTTYSNSLDFKTAMSGVQLCYELANPQTIQLTPEEVKTLVGENNIWSNAGDVDLKYATMNSDMNALMNKSNADIDDASKVADNYLSFTESGGLNIGYTGKTERTNIKADGMRIYVANENSSAELVASFLSNGSTIGKVADGESRTVTSNKGMRFYKRSGSDDITLAHIGYDQGVDADGNTNTYAPYYTFGKRNNRSAIGNYSMAEGFNTTASSYGSHAEGFGTTASGTYSHAEGTNTTASSDYSHAEGLSTTASSNGSHAEGFVTTASSNGSHAEGYHTTASGDYSHAEGDSTTASGPKSHAGGYCTVAGYSGQTVIGKYNSNKSNTAFEIGNGYDEDRSNALTVDWQGNVVASGSLTLNGDEAVADWVTEQGTKGSWKYRKWHSGKVEAWIRWNVGTVAVTTASLPYGGYRSAGLALAIPSGIFTVAPFAVGVKSYSQGGWVAHIMASSATSINAYIGSAASATFTNQTIDVYAWQN